MADPVLHVIAGPNGAGKSTLYEKVIGPATHLSFVNPDVVALERWPEDAAARAYEAAALATERRSELLVARASFVAETVFSHPSKLDFVSDAAARGYLVTLHVVLVPEKLAVARVLSRVAAGSHTVPEDKVRKRYRRLWPLVASAIGLVESAVVYDNSRAGRPFRVVAQFERGRATKKPAWPGWTPEPLRLAGETVKNRARGRRSSPE